MASAIATALIGAMIFGAAATCGIVAAKAILPKLHRFDDAPAALAVSPVALVVGAAVVGGVMGFRTPATDQLVISALAMVCFAAIWYCDAEVGIIPDVFTLVPLALVVGYGLIHRDPTNLFSAIAMFLPFGFLAFISKGRGMGWGDAKLAAFGGALLGISTATGAFILASFVAALAAWLKYRSRKASIAMGPYLIAAMAAALPFNF